MRRAAVGERTWWSTAAVLLAALSVAGCAPDAESDDATPGAVHHRAAATSPLVTEAGFIEVPASPLGPAGVGRMFYSFHPAEGSPEDAPLLLFFNGGPGSATTGGLFAYGTGPMTLEAGADGEVGVFPNPSSWTRFANLLYVDARMTGFSYALDDPGCSVVEGPYPPSLFGNAQLQVGFALADAADFVFVLLDFLKAHPAIQRNEVVFVGESYGGARAMLMDAMLLHYNESSELTSAVGVDVNDVVPGLRERIQRHVDSAFPELAKGPADAPTMRSQFGTNVFIEPGFGYADVVARGGGGRDPVFRATCNHDCVTDDARETAEENEIELAHFDQTFFTSGGIGALLGVELESVEGLTGRSRGPAQRASASIYNRTDASRLRDVADARSREAELEMALGPPAQGDAYWMGNAEACKFFLYDSVGFASLDVLPEVDTFMTHARYDGTISTPVLLSYWRTLGARVAVDANSPIDAARPGVVKVKTAGGEATLRWPTYESGHEVAKTAAAALADDVEAWLASRKRP